MLWLQLAEWWDALDSAQQIFWGIALIFSVLFLIQFILSVAGFDFDSDGELDGGDHDPGSLDASFTILSVRSIIAFFTFFGWGGVLFMREFGSLWLGLGAAFAAGAIAMIIVAYVLHTMTKFDQSGNLDMRKAIFQTGEVYLSIPANRAGYGKIHIKIGKAFREVDAVTSGDALPSGSSIRVVEVLDENLMLVEATRSRLELEQ